MDDYDSDSSLSDVGSGTTTNVLLGYATKEIVDETFSRLGGEPTWSDANEPPPAQLARCKNCSSFMALLLQLNGNLPSRFPGHERSLYLWACRRKTCRRKEGSVRAFRCTKTSKQAQQATANSERISKGPQKNQASDPQAAKKTQDLGSSLFGVKPFSSSTTGASNNPFSASTKESSQASNPFATGAEPSSAPAAKSPQNPEVDADSELPQTFAQKARLSSPAPNSFPAKQAIQPESEPWPAASEFQKPYPLYYLDAEYEYLSPTSDEASNGQQSGSGDTNIYESLMDTEGSKSSSKGKEEAAYESAHDKTFQHFADTVSQNPEQVLRYEFGGSPLLYSRSDRIGNLFAASIPNNAAAAEPKAKVTTNRVAGTVGVPKCPNCNSARVFELQLTPHAIAELEAEEEAATLLGEGMEWGTIIMAVCAEDCSQGVDITTYLEEWVGVQWEEVIERPARRNR